MLKSRFADSLVQFDLSISSEFFVRLRRSLGGFGAKGRKKLT